jgi:hypothetical protein
MAALRPERPLTKTHRSLYEFVRALANRRLGAAALSDR